MTYQSVQILGLLCKANGYEFKTLEGEFYEFIKQNLYRNKRDYQDK